jgi:hypothetical protein
MSSALNLLSISVTLSYFKMFVYQEVNKLTGQLPGHMRYDDIVLQLVNLHRNRRYFVIKLHTWFCLSYFLKTSESTISEFLTEKQKLLKKVITLFAI